MTIRVRSKNAPNDPTHDIDCGPAHGHTTPFKLMRRDIDEAIVFAAGHARVPKVSR